MGIVFVPVEVWVMSMGGASGGERVFVMGDSVSGAVVGVLVGTDVAGAGVSVAK